jgi:hypothetical protein
MHYVTLRSHRLQKRKVEVTCPGVLFKETALGPPDNEKHHVNVSRPGHTRMHYVTRRYHLMQKHMFSVMCSGALFLKSLPVPPKHKK